MAEHINAWIRQSLATDYSIYPSEVYPKIGYINCILRSSEDFKDYVLNEYLRKILRNNMSHLLFLDAFENIVNWEEVYQGVLVDLNLNIEEIPVYY